MAMNEYVHSIGPINVYFSTAIPSGGGFNTGDICFHTDCAAGEAPGWTCVTGGSSTSTWKAWSNVAS